MYMKISPKFPVNPAKFPFFYGWFLVPLAVIGILMSMPGQTSGFSAFTEPLLEVTGFSRTQLSLVYLLGTIISGFLLPLMGSLLDSWGSRNMMVFSSVMLGAALLWLSAVDAIAGLAGGVPGVLVYGAILLIGIFAIRFFGQGLLPMTANTMIGKWFVQKRGRAFAVMGVVNSLAFSATPALMAGLVNGFGWKGAWQLLALIVGAGMGLLAWAFYRDTPELCGLRADGALAVPVGAGAQAVAADSEVEAGVEAVIASREAEGVNASEIQGVTRSEAVRTWVFWIVVLVLATNALILTGFTFHIQAIGLQSGMSLAKAVALFIPVSFISVPVSFVTAFLTEKVASRLIIVVMAFSQLVTCVSVYFLGNHVGYVLTIIGLGFASGMMGPVQSAIVPKLFGRRHLGSINGLITSTIVIMSAVSPMMLSVTNDVLGSLRLGITLMSLLPIATILGVFRVSDTV